MRLERVNPKPYFLTWCYSCGRSLDTSKVSVWADLDGPAFEAYYCERCSTLVGRDQEPLTYV